MRAVKEIYELLFMNYYLAGLPIRSCPYKKISILEGKVEEGKVQESSTMSANWLAVGAPCSGSGWASVLEKRGVGIIRGREKR